MGLECVDSGLASIGGSAGNICKVKPAKEGEECESINDFTLRPNPNCDDGLVCVATGFNSIGGNPVKVCRASAPPKNEGTGLSKPSKGPDNLPAPNPDKRPDNLPSPNPDKKPDNLPAPKPKPTPPSEKYARLGDNCEGFNEETGRPFSPCDDGLRCVFSGDSSIVGREKVCKALYGSVRNPHLPAEEPEE